VLDPRKPVGAIHPNWCAASKQRNSTIDKPTRSASALTVRLLRPLSRIRKNRADPRLARIRTKAMATKIFMVDLRKVEASL
jgi:hypothetical protein